MSSSGDHQSPASTEELQKWLQDELEKSSRKFEEWKARIGPGRDDSHLHPEEQARLLEEDMKRWNEFPWTKVP
jgi:hypothetical protein